MRSSFFCFLKSYYLKNCIGATTSDSYRIEMAKIKELKIINVYFGRIGCSAINLFVCHFTKLFHDII